MANSYLSWVSYWVSIRIIFLDNKAIGFYWPKSSEVSWLRVSSIVYPEASVSIWIWCFRSKWFSIGASTNACLNLIKAFLAPEVRNDPDWLLKFLALEASDFFVWIHFLDLAIFWPLWLFYIGCAGFFLSRFFTWILLPSCCSSPTSTEAAGPAVDVVFSMEVSGAASLLNPWMNHW